MNFSKNHHRQGFSLVELLTSMAILLIMMAGAAAMLNQTQKTWITTWARTSQFRDARLAFELITRNLSQSTLNTYWDYVYDSDDRPIDYQRRSELHFYTDKTSNLLGDEITYPGQSIFFQAVLGYSRQQTYRQLDTLLNARGYFITFGDDEFQKPRFLSSLDNPPPPRWRYRLVEYLPPTENNMIFQADRENRENEKPIEEWFSKELIDGHTRPVVDNVVALIFSPQTSPDTNNLTDQIYAIAPNYRYDSRDESNKETLNILPPLVKTTLIAIDEPTAIRLQDKYGESPPPLIRSEWFQKAVDLEADLKTLERTFVEENIGYRIFTTTVAIRSAKWSH